MPKARESVRSKSKKVRIVVRFPEASEVVLTGDFNQWDPEGIPLSADARGAWSTTLELAPGDYQYRLRVDGEWRDDPDSGRRIPNPFGTENCVLTVE